MNVAHEEQTTIGDFKIYTESTKRQTWKLYGIGADELGNWLRGNGVPSDGKVIVNRTLVAELDTETWLMRPVINVTDYSKIERARARWNKLRADASV